MKIFERIAKQREQVIGNRSLYGDYRRGLLYGLDISEDIAKRNEPTTAWVVTYGVWHEGGNVRGVRLDRDAAIALAREVADKELNADEYDMNPTVTDDAETGDFDISIRDWNVEVRPFPLA